MNRCASFSLQISAFILLGLLAVAQNTGQPAIYTGGSTGYTTDPAGTVVDVYVAEQTVPDFCAKINAAWTSALTNATSATIDARGLVGPQTCSGPTTPFPTKASGRLLLGNATITSSVTWTVPAEYRLV